MRKVRFMVVAAAAAAVVGSAGVGLAADADIKSIAAQLVDIHALVATDYMYSFNQPASDTLPLRVIDKHNNTIALNDAALFFGRNKDDEDFGFNFSLDFGDTAETEASDWDGSGVIGDTSEESNSFELREAFLTYKLPIDLGGSKPTIKAGKFVTLLGYEVLKTNTAFNPNISHSILFGFAVPFTHTGILTTWPITPMFNFSLGVVNGWDNVRDNNHGKTLLAGFGVNPTDAIAIYVAGTYGEEQNGLGDTPAGVGAGTKRAVVTANASFKATDQVTLVVDSVYGNENDLLADPSGGTKDADWYGGALYGILQATDELSFAVRGEIFVDSDGSRGYGFTDAAGVVHGTTTWEVTPTVSYAFTKNILGRFEYRHDESNKPLFQKDNNFQRGSDTVAGEMIVAF